MQNLVWATAYNVVAIPLAAGVLYGVGILLTPALGAVFMSASTINCRRQRSLFESSQIGERVDANQLASLPAGWLVSRNGAEQIYVYIQN